MTVDASLLEILVCPETKVRVVELDPERLAALNAAVQRGSVRYVDGSTVAGPITAALITVDFERIYRVDDGIPVMLPERGIPTDQLR